MKIKFKDFNNFITYSEYVNNFSTPGILVDYINLYDNKSREMIIATIVNKENRIGELKEFSYSTTFGQKLIDKYF